jgi:hypothetical protein
MRIQRRMKRKKIRDSPSAAMTKKAVRLPEGLILSQ